MRRLIPIVVAGVLTACNSGSSPTIAVPTVPTPTAPQTVYTGSITDSVIGAGSLTVTIGTSGSAASGTWLATFPGQRVSTRFITGTVVNGFSYSAIVSDCVESDASSCFPNCRQTLTGSLTSTALSGTYEEVAGDSCTAHTGSVSAKTQ